MVLGEVVGVRDEVGKGEIKMGRVFEEGGKEG